MQTQSLSGAYIAGQILTWTLLNVVARRKRIFSYQRYHAAQYIVVSAIFQGVFKKTEPLPRTNGRVKVCWAAEVASLGFVAFGVSYLKAARKTKTVLTVGIFSSQFAIPGVRSRFTVSHIVRILPNGRNRDYYPGFGGHLHIRKQHQIIKEELDYASIGPEDTSTWERCAEYAQGKLNSKEFADISCLYRVPCPDLVNRSVTEILQSRDGRYAYFHGTRTLNDAISILKDGQIKVMHRGAFPGAFVSNRPESGYGPYYFAFSRKIEWGSPLKSGVNKSGGSYWAGFSEPIKTTEENLSCMIVDGDDGMRDSLREQILLDQELGPSYAWIPIFLLSEQKAALQQEGLSLDTPERCVPINWPARLIVFQE